MELNDEFIGVLTRIADALEGIEKHMRRDQIEVAVTTTDDFKDLQLQHEQARKTTLPADMGLSKPMADYVRVKWFAAKLGTPTELELSDMFEAFCVYHRKQGSKFKNWFAAWQTWVRNETKYRKTDQKAVDAGPRGTLL